MEKQPHYLVVGADSMVGCALVQRMKHARMRVTGTTRRRDTIGGANLFLDLTGATDSWHPPHPVDVAIICAGVTRIQACKDNPMQSAKVNVDGVVNLAKNLQRSGAFVIHLSTNQVFDGSTPFRSTNDPTCPVSEYGRQKAEAECRLRECETSCAIVRFTKILGPQTALFLNWADALRRGEAIQAFSDMTLAPVPLSCVTSVLLLIAAEQLVGTFHVSGERDISYEAAARIGAEVLGADVRLVEPVNTTPASVGGEPVPLHTTLDMDVLKTTLGIVPPDVQWTIEKAFANPELLAAA